MAAARWHGAPRPNHAIFFFYLSPLSFPRLSLSLSPSNTETRDSSVGSVLPSRPEQLHHLSLLPRLIQELVSSYIVLISRCKCMNYTLPSQFLYFPSAFAIFLSPFSPSSPSPRTTFIPPSLLVGEAEFRGQKKMRIIPPQNLFLSSPLSPSHSYPVESEAEGSAPTP